MLELIINPTAGNGLAKQIGDEAAKLLFERSIPFEMRLSDHPGHATELARDAAQRGVDTVLAFGGDGTVTEVAAGLRGSQTALGIVPCGTGNDFIKTIGTPKDWREALNFILNTPARPINTGLMNERLFLNVCGTGFDVMVLDFAEHVKAKLHGIWPYLYGVIRAIKAFAPKEMHIEIGEDTVLDGKFMICAVGNGRWIGGGIPITPLAQVDDGLFDILVVDAVPRWKIPFYLPSLMTGTLYKHKPAHRYQAKTCYLRSESMRVQLDGEVASQEEARFACETDALLLHW